MESLKALFNSIRIIAKEKISNINFFYNEKINNRNESTTSNSGNNHTGNNEENTTETWGWFVDPLETLN